MKQLISIPTRVTSKTSTLIDHVLSNSSQKVNQSGVFELGISDNNLVYSTRKTPSLKSNKHNDISVRKKEKLHSQKTLRATKKN